MNLSSLPLGDIIVSGLRLSEAAFSRQPLCEVEPHAAAFLAIDNPNWVSSSWSMPRQFACKTKDFNHCSLLVMYVPLCQDRILACLHIAFHLFFRTIRECV
jgi:hypothetical protein